MVGGERPVASSSLSLHLCCEAIRTQIDLCSPLWSAWPASPISGLSAALQEARSPSSSREQRPGLLRPSRSHHTKPFS